MPTPTSSWSASGCPTRPRSGATPVTWPGWGATSAWRPPSDVDALLALRPDCIVHTAMADDRLMEALADLAQVLARRHQRRVQQPGVPAVPRRPVMPWMASRPGGGGRRRWRVALGQRRRPRVRQRRAPAGPHRRLRRIDEVRCIELLNYATYDQATVLFDIMGFGKPMDQVPMLLQPGVLTMAWGSVVRQLAAGLDIELDSDRGVLRAHARARRLPRSPPGTIARGTAAALRFEVRGMRHGRPVVVLEHVTRLRDDLAPDWPQPAGQGCYRVMVTGEPNYTLDLQLLGTDGDHNTAGLKATAMRLVNAVPAVVAAEPGLRDRPRPADDHRPRPRPVGPGPALTRPPAPTWPTA